MLVPKYNEDGSINLDVQRAMKEHKVQVVPNSNHRYGLVADPLSVVAKMQNHRRLFGALKSGLPSSVSLSDGVLIRDQSYTQSCLGFAMATAIRSRLYRQGHRFDPSPMYIYTLARMMYEEPEEPLIDVGSMPHSAVEGLQTYGVISETDMPFDTSKINEEVPWDLQHKGSGFLVRGIYKVGEASVDTSHSVCEALSRGFPVFMGTYMTDALEGYQSGVLEPEDIQGPGHAMCIVGYEDNGDVFEVANSWGESFGEQGYVWLHRSFIEHRLTGHLYVVPVERS